VVSLVFFILSHLRTTVAADTQFFVFGIFLGPFIVQMAIIAFSRLTIDSVPLCWPADRMMAQRIRTHFGAQSIRRQRTERPESTCYTLTSRRTGIFSDIGVGPSEATQAAPDENCLFHLL
jgi:hypothetical protein